MMNMFFACKKRRCSERLVVRDSSTKAHNDSVALGPTGLFQLVPIELKFLILDYLPVMDLSVLTITSKGLRDIVELYANAEKSDRRFFRLSVIHSVELQPAIVRSCLLQFQLYGYLCKRLTCLYPTKDRLKFVLRKLSKYHCTDMACPRPDKCFALTCYGHFLQTFTAGWEDRECSTTFDLISQSAIRQLQSLVKLSPGCDPVAELHVRLFFRRAILDSHTDADRSLWLNLILRPFPMVHQARVLFLLFGPILNGLIQWYELCDKTPSTPTQTMLCFGELADAFRMLHRYSRDWSEDSVISVIDELMCAPDEWLPENVAGQLYLCGETITVKVLTSKALNGRVSELSAIFLSLCLVCARQNDSISWVTDVIRRVCRAVDNRRDRRALLKGVVDAFQTVITDLHEFAVDPASALTAFRDIQNLLNVQASFVWQVVQIAFDDILSK